MDTVSIELTAAVHARNPERVDAAIGEMLDSLDEVSNADAKWCAVMPAMKRAVKAVMELRGPKEEQIDAIVKSLAAVASQMHYEKADCGIFDDVLSEAARAGSSPDRLIDFMNSS
eukprot:2525714-Prymnesium_polylepis.2